MGTIASLTDKVNLNPRPDYPVIDATLNAYIGFIENWDRKEMENIRQIKALGLDDNDNVLFEISIKVGKVVNLQQDMQEALRVAKHNGAKKVVFGINQPNKRVYPSPQEKTLARKIIDFAKDLGIPVKDQLVVSGSSYFSFADNGIK